jgi:hypothetical protein
VTQAHTPFPTCSEESLKKKGKKRKSSSSSSSSDGGVRGDELSVPNFHPLGDGLVCGALDDLPDHDSGHSQGEKPALPLLRVYALSQVPDHAPQKGQSYSAFQFCHFIIKGRNIQVHLVAHWIPSSRRSSKLLKLSH